MEKDKKKIENENSIIKMAERIAHAESSERTSKESLDIKDVDDGSVLDLATDIARAESLERFREE